MKWVESRPLTLSLSRETAPVQIHTTNTAATDYGFDALRAAQNYRRALVGEFNPHLKGRVLDVGAGTGQFTSLLSTLGDIKELLAVEPDPAFTSELRRAHPQLQVIEGTVTAVPESPAWDALVCVNVLEHIPDDWRELTEYARRLRPGTGCLCLFVPARPEIYAPIDRDFGHCRRYTRDGLWQKLEQAGFAVVRLDYFNLFGYAAWWLNFRLLRRRRFDRAAVWLFDRFIFPCVHWCESRVARPPIGQNLLAVARPLGDGEKSFG